MKIAFQNENVTLWHGDCLEILPTLPGGDFANTVVTGIENAANTVVSSVESFTGKVAQTTNPPPKPSSTSRGGGGYSCACACAWRAGPWRVPMR